MSNYLKYCRQKGCAEQESYEEPVWPERNEECGEKRESKNCDWIWEKCKPEPEKPKFPVTILSCGKGSGLALPVNGVALAVAQSGSGYCPYLVVGTVTVDARGLEDPTIKIDFSSLINYRVVSTQGDFAFRLIFQLSRACNNGPKVALATYTYENSLAITGSVGEPSPIFDIKDSFSFTWCECNDCGGCCTYFVEIIDISSYNIESASITNVGINAAASGLPEHHR